MKVIIEKLSHITKLENIADDGVHLQIDDENTLVSCLPSRIEIISTWKNKAVENILLSNGCKLISENKEVFEDICTETGGRIKRPIYTAIYNYS